MSSNVRSLFVAALLGSLALWGTPTVANAQDPTPSGGFEGDTHTLDTGELRVAAAASSGVAYAGMVPIPPARILDTRNGTGVTAAGKLGQGRTLTLQVSTAGGVPAVGVDAVAINVTVTGSDAASFLTVFPTGVIRPVASNLNLSPGHTTANLVIAKLGTGGRVGIYNNTGNTHVVVDVVGYSVDADHLTSLTPERILDTRSGTGVAAAGKVGRAKSIVVQVTGEGGVPETGVDAVVLNVTATEPTDPSYVTVHPSGTPRPNASSLNVERGDTVPNLVVTKVGTNGAVTMYNNNGQTHLVADVVAWIATGTSYVAINPTRVMDTRTGLGTYGVLTKNSGGNAGILDRLPGPLGAQDSVTLDVVGLDPSGPPIPHGAFSAVLNVTAVYEAPGPDTFITVYPNGQSRPNASTLNATSGETIANPTVALMDDLGVVDIYNNQGNVHVIVDVVGYTIRRNVTDAPDDLAQGTQIHVVHAIPSGNAATFGDAEIAYQLGLIDTHLSTVGGRTPRWDTSSGATDVSRLTIGLTKAQLEVASNDGPFDDMIDQMMIDGYVSPNKVYLVLVDGVRRSTSTSLVCGEAVALSPESLAADGYDIVDDIDFARWAFVWTGNCSGTPRTTGTYPTTFATTALHEIFHTLGAAPDCGAQTDGAGHTTDSTDLMFAFISATSALDPGNNDYWNHTGTSCVRNGSTIPHPDLFESSFVE